uniref:Uncharacterized protein n=1 Tax=Cacopsylla melanoneura TaxID=428564 RepID=A0A8D8S8C1_9HEMI
MFIEVFSLPRATMFMEVFSLPRATTTIPVRGHCVALTRRTYLGRKPFSGHLRRSVEVQQGASSTFLGGGEDGSLTRTDKCCLIGPRSCIRLRSQKSQEQPGRVEGGEKDCSRSHSV